MTATGLVTAIPPPAITDDGTQHGSCDGVHTLRLRPPVVQIVVADQRHRYRDQVSALPDTQPYQGREPSTGTPRSVAGEKRCFGTSQIVVRLRGHREMPAPIRGLALCAGAGGLELGIGLALPHYRTVAFVERAPAAVAVLKARMRDGCLHRAPVFDDLRAFDGKAWRSRVDFLSAGYPCQPFSSCGRRRGFEDPRNLWPHVARVIRETAAPAVFLENVAGHLSLGFPVVARDLRAMGYRFAAGVFSAGEVGASHERRRLFVLAHADRLQRRRPGPHAAGERAAHLPVRRSDVDPGDAAAGGSPVVVPDFPPGPLDFGAWRRLLAARPGLEPTLRRDAPGMAGWVDRQRLTGNGVCSLAAAHALATLGRALAGGAAGRVPGSSPPRPVGRPGQGPA